MHVRKLPWLETAVFGVALISLVLAAGGGPGWGAASARAVVAVGLDRSGAAPLYDVLAAVAARLPLGEPGFRLALLGAVLGAALLAGVVAAARALLPKDPLAGLIGALVLVLAPPLRDAIGFASPGALAAAATVWAIAFALRGNAVWAIAASTAVLGSAPYLGAALLVAIVATSVRSTRALLAIGAAGVACVVLWIGAVGTLPPIAPSLATALGETGRGAAAIVVGAGLLGAGFGALTGLRSARWLAAITAIVAAHELVVPGNAAPLLAVLAIGAAILPAAIARAATSDAATGDAATGDPATRDAAAPPRGALRRDLIALVAGVPLLAAAFATGATVRISDPGATPARLVDDLVRELPAGPGVFVATHATSYYAAAYEAAIAGVRPDLALVPPMPANRADAVVADAIRAGHIAGADAAAFGRLDVRRAVPRGRGFQLVGELPAQPSPVVPPAAYPTETGAQQAILLALERARLEAASGRLDAAARAAGLEHRFGAADLAVLAATVPTRDRPALFGFLPLDDRPPGPWLIDVLGDDLAWVAGLAEPALPPDAPIARRLHARWRAVLAGKTTADDPEIVALGSRAVAATYEMLKELR